MSSSLLNTNYRGVIFFDHFNTLNIIFSLHFIFFEPNLTHLCHLWFRIECWKTWHWDVLIFWFDWFLRLIVVRWSSWSCSLFHFRSSFGFEFWAIGDQNDSQKMRQRICTQFKYRLEFKHQESNHWNKSIPAWEHSWHSIGPIEGCFQRGRWLHRLELSFGGWNDISLSACWNQNWEKLMWQRVQGWMTAIAFLSKSLSLICTF